MPDRCVVYGCSSEGSTGSKISFHRIPYFGDTRTEAKARRKRWVDFVRRFRDRWEPTKNAIICSEHFLPEDYNHMFSGLEGQTSSITPRLRRDDFGICVAPSVHKFHPRAADKEKSISRRSRRMVLKEAVASTCESCEHDEDQDMEIDEEPTMPASVPSAEVHSETSHQTSAIISQPEESKPDCDECVRLAKQCRKLRNLWLDAKSKLRTARVKAAEIEKKCNCDDQMKHKVPRIESRASQQQKQQEDQEDQKGQDESEESDEGSELNDDHEEVFFCEEDFITETETETTETESDDDESSRWQRFKKPVNSRSEPKFITFLSNLLRLFQFCYFCKSDNTTIKYRANGTMIEVKSVCNNLSCKKEYIWSSQPTIPGTRIAAVNFLLSFGILVSGGSPSKILTMLRHMGVSCLTLKTFFSHQKNILFPAIHLHWKHFQLAVFDLLKAAGDKLTLCGDGRHDSMGHSAKYCTYSIFCCDQPQIIHFVLTQKNEAGSSQEMECFAFKKAMDFLSQHAIEVGTFISDRHSSIAKYLREELSHIIHYFDLWHLKKKINKVLTAVTKCTGGEDLKPWINACCNHFYWSAQSTPSGNGKVIWAKFKSFLSHIIDKHEKLDDPLFDKCKHGPLPGRKWLKENSLVYEKVCAELTKPRLMKAIQKSSPIEQTSCLEGFHSVLNHFAPKMIHFSYPGMYCRQILAVIHFNYNLDREVKKNPDGSTKVSVIFPKFKNGEAVVRDQRISQNFNYVEEIFQTCLKAVGDNSLAEAKAEINRMVPAPMNTMFTKEPREEAIKKREERRSMVVEAVEPTPEQLRASENAEQESRPQAKSKPHCRICKNPMKGHKNVLNCPKNLNQL